MEQAKPLPPKLQRQNLGHKIYRTGRTFATKYTELWPHNLENIQSLGHKICRKDRALATKYMKNEEP